MKRNPNPDFSWRDLDWSSGFRRPLNKRGQERLGRLNSVSGRNHLLFLSKLIARSIFSPRLGEASPSRSSPSCSTGWFFVVVELPLSATQRWQLGQYPVDPFKQL